MAAATERSELSVESVVRELRARNKAFQDAKQQLENTRATIALLDRAIQLRLEKWHYFRRFVAVRARANFALHLQNRGFSGSLHFDHNAQTLKLRVRWFSDGRCTPVTVHSLWTRTRRRSRAAKSRLRPYACCSRCGRLSGARSGASTSSMCLWTQLTAKCR